jgi:uncharacterized protein (DUF58 family)
MDTHGTTGSPLAAPARGAELVDPGALARLGRMDVAARLAAESFLAGRHRSVRRGFSVEFSDYREYAPGDDVADIDWRVYARTNKYYLKCFQAETSVRCVLAVDVSASMAYRSRQAPLSKLRYAAMTAAALGFLLQRQRDRVGLALFDDRLRRLVPPRSRRAHYHSILGLLAAELESPAPGDAARGLESLAGQLRRSGMTVVLSDLLTARGEALLRSVEQLAWRGQNVLLLQVLDPAELSAAPDAGGGTLRDPESGREYPADSATAARCRQRLQDLIGGYRKAFSALGADYALLTTDVPFDRALGAFLAARGGRHGAGRPAPRRRLA